jgi:beta-galactosidase
MKYILNCLLVLLPAFSLAQDNSRISYTINSGWKFHKGDTDIMALKTEAWQSVNIPHTWNASDPFDNVPGYYRGVSWYSKNIDVPQEWSRKKVFLYFNGVNQEATVFVNNRLAGAHQGGYTAFSIDITPFLNFGSQNIVTVRADNSYNRNVPPLNADFNFYGGIYRDVQLMITEPVHFDMGRYASGGVFIETPKVSVTKSIVSVHGGIYNETAGKKNLEVYTSILNRNHQEVARSRTMMTIRPGSTREFRQEDLVIDNPSLWSPQSPYLYSVYTVIKDLQTGAVLDQAVNPLGIRSFFVDPDKGFFLNGKSLPLMGVS